MPLSYALPTALDYFASLVRGDSYFPLFEAAASLAQDEVAALDLESVQDEMDQWQGRLRSRLPSDAGDLQKMRILNQFFFSEMGFTANANDFYAPENSYIPVVMRTRRGIPISLAVIWLEIARGLGLKAHGVSFPGHFLVKINLSMGPMMLDPMSGRSLGRDQLAEMLLPFRRSTGLNDEQDAPLKFFLQNARPQDIVSRMLWNLKEIFNSREDWPRLLHVLERLIVLMPDSWPDYRDRGLVHAKLGHTQQAMADLECYMVHSDNLADIDRIADQVDALRRLRN